jgi:hypothetical protein
MIINFVYYFIIPLCIMADIIRKPIQMVGFGVLGAGSGALILGAIGFSIIFVNDSIGKIQSGLYDNDWSNNSATKYKPLDPEIPANIFLLGIICGGLGGGVAGVVAGIIL